MTSQRLAYGDKVRHARRPEWGTGTITRVEETSTQGLPAQRLSIRFDNAGLKILDAGAAPLERLNGSAAAAAPAPPLAGGGPLETLELSGLPQSLLAKKTQELMTALPEEVRDPFNSLRHRLRRTCELFRFTREGGSIIAWAVAQTGLADPMTRFNRHELEVFFDRWARERDAHLARLLAEAGTEGQLVREELASAPPAAREAARRAKAAR